MYPEAVALQDASSSTEPSVAGMAFCNRIKCKKTPPKRSAERNNLPVKLLPPHFAGKVKSSVQDHGIQYLPPSTQERGPWLEKGIPVTAVSMKGMSVKSVPYGQAISVKAPPEVPEVVPKQDR